MFHRTSSLDYQVPLQEAFVDLGPTSSCADNHFEELATTKCSNRHQPMIELDATAGVIVQWEGMYRKKERKKRNEMK
jgi:hypothetical protein